MPVSGATRGARREVWHAGRCGLGSGARREAQFPAAAGRAGHAGRCGALERGALGARRRG